MARALLELLVPRTCWSCRRPARGLDPLCDGCMRALPWLNLRESSPGLDDLWIPLALDGPARDLVHALKFRAAPGVAAAMAWHVLDGAPPALLAPPAAVVPVPAHPWRARIRGYDHAGALAAAIADAGGRPLICALRRSGGSRARQRGRSRAGRLAGAGLAVEVAGVAVPRRCVLVDDVRTTGATLEACASALRSAGASSVSAIAYAQVL